MVRVNFFSTDAHTNKNVRFFMHLDFGTLTFFELKFVKCSVKVE